MNVNDIKSSTSANIVINQQLFQAMVMVGEHHDVVDHRYGRRHDFVFIDEHVVSVSVDFSLDERDSLQRCNVTMMVVSADGHAVAYERPFHKSLRGLLGRRDDRLATEFAAVCSVADIFKKRSIDSYVAKLDVNNEITGLNVRQLVNSRTVTTYSSPRWFTLTNGAVSSSIPVCVSLPTELPNVETVLELIQATREQLDPSIRVDSFDQLVELNKLSVKHVDSDYLQFDNGPLFIMHRGRPLLVSLVNVDGAERLNREVNDLRTVVLFAIGKRRRVCATLGGE